MKQAETQLTVAVVGLGFGSTFARIFACHPQVKKVYAIDSDPDHVAETLRLAEIEHRGDDRLVAGKTLEEALADPEVDAVHICTGIPSHAALTVQALRAGKHVLCAVPMATSEEDIRAIIEAARESGKVYMMAETTLFGSPYYYAEEMKREGRFGKIQHLRCIHYQPMEGGMWNTDVHSYWRGLPPMHYATHAIAPLVGIAGSRIRRVTAMSGGSMSKELTENYGNPYPVEEALLSFENGLCGEVVRGLFECAALPTESFNVYGSQCSFLTERKEFEVVEKFRDLTHPEHARFRYFSVPPVNYYRRLPRSLWSFTVRYFEGCENDENYLRMGLPGDHWASHPHIVHEFVSAVIEGRKALLNEDVSANITLAGICAHRSAMSGGEPIDLPVF